MKQRRIGLALIAATTLGATSMGPAVAADSVVRVDADGDGGWLFNRDASTSTPYEFTTAEASIGAGSLFVQPIGSNPSDKFIAEQYHFGAAGAFESVAYDFAVASGGATAYVHFYLNVYVELPGGVDNYYDCRFDYVPGGANGSDFTTFSVDRTSTPVNVAAANDGVGACPATLDGLPADATIEVLAINVGDTSANDEGVSGYLDNVSVTSGGSTTVFDFEAPLTSKDGCKRGGWVQYGFRNQGQCVASLVANDGG